jgi:hypothetical protein
MSVRATTLSLCLKSGPGRQGADYRVQNSESLDHFIFKARLRFGNAPISLQGIDDLLALRRGRSRRQIDGVNGITDLLAALFVNSLRTGVGARREGQAVNRVPDFYHGIVYWNGIQFSGVHIFLVWLLIEE